METSKDGKHLNLDFFLFNYISCQRVICFRHLKYEIFHIRDSLQFQNQTPIYNFAAGTCLYVKQPKAGAIVQLGLCSNDANSSWDMVRKPL